MSGLFVLEFFTGVTAKAADFPESGFYNPYRQFPEYIRPTPPSHYTTEGGGRYSARPDLTRVGGPGVYVIGATGGIVIGSVYVAAVTTQAYSEIIKDETPDAQQSMWRSFAQSLTGGVGAGSWTY